MADLLVIAQLACLLLAPVLVILLRVDKRMAQVDVLIAAQSDDMRQMKQENREINSRLARLEARNL